ncbi:putative membrane protein [Halanaeroarchaeum sp. HSR-CO]|uniref:DUF192 domain-containing protein n=1 Tax=Halanaeroarchaeum sp. HSR-CO TaxID=2866382 RepID=UPI00217F1FE4|nr:DUF192 domain-containing protein [Halanaeroarchaeum sp. HSR-CO]UWG47103.1 putative membrane protein [Halanaeroarchaeum sp. HSR-CO]
MPSRTAILVAALLALALLLAIPAAGPEPGTENTEADTVTVLDESGDPLGTVTVMVADTPDERYTGLSDTESLDPNEGMLFVFDSEAERAFVMRNMSFPIDIVFVDADRTITAVHHAPVENDDGQLTRYRGQGKWVLEVPYNWTTEHDVEVGDQIRIDHANETDQPTGSTAT